MNPAPRAKQSHWCPFTDRTLRRPHSASPHSSVSLELPAAFSLLQSKAAARPRAAPQSQPVLSTNTLPLCGCHAQRSYRHLSRLSAEPAPGASSVKPHQEADPSEGSRISLWLLIHDSFRLLPPHNPNSSKYRDLGAYAALQLSLNSPH